jgi:hypothetical protein
MTQDAQVMPVTGNPMGMEFDGEEMAFTSNSLRAILHNMEQL